MLALLEVPVEDQQWQAFDPSQRRRYTLEAIKHLLLRESQVQPLCLMFEDLHWIDTETQALLDSLVESLPTARLLLLVNYRPEYQHGWGSKTSYTQLRLDPLPPASADEFLQALLGSDPGLDTAHTAPDCPTQGNPFFLEESVRTLVETGVLVGERGAYRLARPLRRPAGPGHGAGGARRTYRPAATGGQAPAPDRGGDWHGGALAAVAGHCRRARRGVAPRPGAPASRRVPLRNQPVPGARLHLQARPDARGRLWGAATRAATPAPWPHCGGHRTARSRPARRPGGTAGAPCPAGRGVGQGRRLLPPGGRQGGGTLSQSRGGDVLRAGAGRPGASPRGS